MSTNIGELIFSKSVTFVPLEALIDEPFYLTPRNSRTQKFAVLLPTAAIFSTVGFIARAVNTLHVGDAKTAWRTSHMFTLGAAPTYAAADYLICGRLFSYIPYAAPISPLRVVRTFIAFDVLAEIGVWAGAALSEGSNDGTKARVGLNLVRAAIMIQCALFLAFICVLAAFHVRAVRCGIWGLSIKGTGRPGSAYHIAESFVPKDHPFVTSEIPFLMLEAFLLLLNTAMFNIFHPSYLLPLDPCHYLLLNNEEASSERVGKSLYDTRSLLQIVLDPLDIKGLFSRRDKEPLVCDPEAVGLNGNQGR
ncbi:hypothetical protein FQN54_000579 [Arachnomyces sp. PD_36]|nr:hypothetical protein FQN54_000579 [Arachnomyces sp. PD_36]